MKFLYIILLSLSVASLSRADLCEWQTKRDNLIKKLTPPGQNVTKQILKDLQYITGAAMQPIYEQIKEEYKMLVNKLIENDKQAFDFLLNLLGYGNPNCGAGDLVDLCKYETDKRIVVSMFKRSNRVSVLILLKAIDDKYFRVYPSLLAVNRQLDDNFYQYLIKNEDPYVLEALAKLFV